MRVKGEHLACELPTVVQRHSEPVIDEGQHLAAL